MSTYLPLPTKNSQLVDALDEACTAAEDERNVAYVDWIIAHYYLQGVRQFEVWNWLEGDVHLTYEGDDEEVTFRYEALLQQYKTELGRYMRIDVDPMAEPDGHGVDSVRKAGVAHAILRYMTSGLATKQVQSRFVQTLLKFGTAGLSHYRGMGGTIRDRTCVEVVPPWEMLAIPAEVQHLDDLRGIIRKRSVTLEWLKMQKALKIGSKDDMRVVEMPYGGAPNKYGLLEDATPGGSGSTPFQKIGEEQRSSQISKEGKSKAAMQEWVDIEEVWMLGQKETVSEYVVKVGGHIAKRDEYYKNGMYDVVPGLGVARHTPTGRFYGRSWVGPLLGLNDQIEKMLARQFQIISDQDEYGMLVVPTTSGITTFELEKRERRKVIRAEPDPINPDYRPYKIDPNSSGDYPGKLANLGVQLQDKLSGQGEIFQGQSPGRTEAASALGFLYETGNIALIPTSNELADAYRVVFRSMLQEARRELRQEGGSKALHLPIIDDRMLGVVIDPGGQMLLDSNPVPEPKDVKVDIVDRAPVSKQHLREEAMRLFEAQLMDDVQFNILNFRENLGFPIVDRAAWESWRKAVYQKIILFGDGKRPGPININVEADNPEIALEVCMVLMNSLEFLLASDEVRAGFEEWKMGLEAMLGRYPSQLPSPDEMMMVGQGGQGGQAPQRSSVTGPQTRPALPAAPSPAGQGTPRTPRPAQPMAR